MPNAGPISSATTKTRLSKRWPAVWLAVPNDKPRRSSCQREHGRRMEADAMNILVACEFSGIVRDAFWARGHNAWSCDLLPGEQPGPHIQGDILEAVHRMEWDLIIAHPPCTHLAVSGARWFKDKQADQADAIRFFMA